MAKHMGWNRDRKLPTVTLPCLLRPEPPGARQAESDPNQRVSVTVHPQVLAQVHPLTRATLQTLIKTNIVCTARLSGPVAIEEMALNSGGTYIPDKFPSCLGDSDNPDASWTAFRKGYFRCAGGDTREKAEVVLNMLAFRLFLESRMTFRLYNFSVHNIVTAATLPYELNLQRLSDMDPVKYDYKPDMFPGAMYRMKKPKLVIQIFESGKLNIVGAKDIKEPVQAILVLEPILRQCRIFVFRLLQAPLLSTRNKCGQLQPMQDTHPSGRVQPEVRVIDDKLVKQMIRHKDIVVSQEKAYRQTKKNEKAIKETKKKQQNERKALKSQQAQLAKRRQKELGRAGYRNGESKELQGWSPHLTLLERDMLMIRDRLNEIPEDGLGDEEKAVFTLAIRGKSRERPFMVELFADAKMNVLDADTQEQAEDVYQIMESLLQQCESSPVMTTTGRGKKRLMEVAFDESSVESSCEKRSKILV